MNGPESYTAAQAADPRTPAHVLADVAALRPDLRPAIASNPATYPALVTWLSELKDPAVDAALAARTAPGPSEPATGTTTAPATGQWSAPAPYTPGPGTAPPPSTPATPPPVPSVSHTREAHFSATAPMPFAAGPYAGAPAGPPAGGGSSRAVLWVVLGVVVAVVVVVVGAVVVLRGVTGVLGSVQIPEVTEPGSAPGSSAAGSYGDDPRLDALWDQCAAGDDAACDDLYLESPFGSQYEEFGDTCGHRDTGGAWCVGSRG